MCAIRIDMYSCFVCVKGKIIIQCNCSNFDSCTVIHTVHNPKYLTLGIVCAHLVHFCWSSHICTECVNFTILLTNQVFIIYLGIASFIKQIYIYASFATYNIMRIGVETRQAGGPWPPHFLKILHINQLFPIQSTLSKLCGPPDFNALLPMLLMCGYIPVLQLDHIY